MNAAARTASWWTLPAWVGVAVLSQLIMIAPVLDTWGRGTGEYFLTSDTVQAWGGLWPLRVLLQVGVGIALGCWSRLPLFAITGGALIVYPVLMGIEGCAASASHNLAGIELALALPFFLPLPIGAGIARRWLSPPSQA